MSINDIIKSDARCNHPDKPLEIPWAHVAIKFFPCLIQKHPKSNWKMSSSPVVNALLTNALMGGLLYGVNVFLEVTKDEQARLTGLMVLSAITIAALFAYVWTWNTVRTWTFYLVAIPFFLTSSFDVLATIDSWLMPNGIFLKEYLQAHDLHLHSIVPTIFVFLDGTVLQAINLMAIYKMSQGSSARSLLLVPAMSLAFLTSAYTICTQTSGIPLHPLTVSIIPATVVYLVLLPLGVLRIPRNYTLSPKNSLGNDTQSLSWLTSALLAAGALVIVAKALVVAGVRNGLLDIVRLNDPLILLDDVEETIPFIKVVIWQYVLVSLPLFAISIFYHFKTAKPAFLWEVAVANFAFLLTGQFIFIVGSFYWKTPEDLRVDPTNAVFWIINLIPLNATLAQIESLSLYRSSLVSKQANVKKRS
ncbi:unnamed protein product [Allacma fusca]|uniref:Uncharacterized protein n=1 Tax=Allacma fusca TaxID=39272 RepID=A0A8J2PK65_9HEXA|nr:unnamed protein product [Allacma fusca]